MMRAHDGRDAPSVSLGTIDTDDVPPNVPIALLIINLLRPAERECSEEDLDAWQALEDSYCHAYVNGDGASQIEASLDVAGATRAYLGLPSAFSRCVERCIRNARHAERLTVHLTGSRDWKLPLWMRHAAFEVTRG